MNLNLLLSLLVLACCVTQFHGLQQNALSADTPVAVVKREDSDYGDYSDYYENYEGEGGGDDDDDGNMGEDEVMGKGLISLNNLARGVTNAEVMRKHTRMALLKIGKVLQKFGPAMKVVGFLVSALTIFLKDGQPESPELKFLKKKFAEVNAKLDIITNRLDDVQTAIEYTGAKVSFGQYTRKIKSLRRNLQYVLSSKSTKRRKRNQSFFMESFMNTYDDSAMILYQALMGDDQDYFGYDLLEQTSKKFKCNVQKMTDLCVIVSKTLVDALTVEGAFFGFRNMTWRIQEEGDVWRQRMAKVGKRCQEYLNKCANEWKKYAEPVFNNAYNKKYSASNADLADHLFKELNENIPQRAWGVFVYDDTWGFDTHTVSKVNDHSFVQWHKHGKIVTICTADLRRSNFKSAKAKEVMDKAVGDIPNCSLNKPKDPALQLVNGMRRHYGYWPGGCIYAVQRGKGLEVRADEKHFATRDAKKTQQCGKKRIGYNHHMYLFN